MSDLFPFVAEVGRHGRCVDGFTDKRVVAKRSLWLFIANCRLLYKSSARRLLSVLDFGVETINTTAITASTTSFTQLFTSQIKSLTATRIEIQKKWN